MTTAAIPPLRQSLVEVMSCPHSYAFQVIEGKQMPGGLQSARGVEIHQVMSRYIAHCARRKVAADWAKFDELALGAGPEAAEILNGLRDSYAVDWEHVYETEFAVGSDDGDAQGTLDNLLFLTQLKAKIEDFKSHPRPFEPDTDQSRRYSFLVFENFPDVQEVTFELIFVRYANCRRSVTFTREDDLPVLRQHMVNSRLRQMRIHEQHAAGQTLPAYPGNPCQYCPLLQKPFACPISETNPETTDPQEWLRFVIWAGHARGVAMQALKNHVDASGIPVEVMDGNERPTQIGFHDHETRRFPLEMVLEALSDWQEASGEDLKPKLFVSSTKLKQYAGEKKRAILDQYLKDHAELVSRPKFDIKVPGEQAETERREAWEED
jgi:hypothetical protein